MKGQHKRVLTAHCPWYLTPVAYSAVAKARTHTLSYMALKSSVFVLASYKTVQNFTFGCCHICHVNVLGKSSRERLWLDLL